MQGDELSDVQTEPDVEAGSSATACSIHHGSCQTRRRVYYLVYGLLAAGATLLNWCLMHTSGYSMPALAVLTSMIAWVFLLGTLLPFGYRSLLDADVMEVGDRPVVARLTLTAMLAMSLAFGVLTCWLLGMPVIIPFTPAVE
ncbi:MAG TPA: hypothetical protein VG826_13825 [Pirellulales bacterium]|nr:hypothetical protein [Pirellulales bacterium]